MASMPEAPTWTVPVPEPPEGPTAGDERPLLVAHLGWHRHVLLNVCAGLSAEQLATRALPPSRLSLLGLVRHMAKVERVWFRQRVVGAPIEPLHGGPGHPDDFELIDPARARAEVEALEAEWQAADEAVAGLPLEHTFDLRGGEWSLRMIYLHMIGEYARHNGHADLLREQIDGITGR
jgi:uncharacterized damage-inducible protein DinB